jgi:hypothetical protein
MKLKATVIYADTISKGLSSFSPYIAMSKFQVFAHKGFQVTFDNGYKVSVMFGAGNYCEHRFNEQIQPINNHVKVWERHTSEDAEVAVFNQEDDFVSGFPGCSDCDQVRGWVTTNDVLAVMNWAANQ